jgi:AGCS family alanine or glycine:cation symporter
MLEPVTAVLKAVSDFLWGLPLIVVILGGGIYLTFLSRFIQLKKLRHAFDIVRGKYDDPDDEGDISHFQALTAALSGTIGIGNIAGVATAMHVGGPGALFWMWVSAFVGMATKYAECTLSHHYRAFDREGAAAGGAMYFIEKGLGPKWKPLALTFAACTVIASMGSSNIVQSNTVAGNLHADIGIPTWITGVVLAVLLAVVIVGGIKRIGQVASRLVPIMSVFYVGGAATVLLMHAGHIPDAFATIFHHAFNPTAAGGGFLGSTVALTLQWGIKRGLFSNEAGQGSAPIAHAAAKTKEPVREGLVAMAEPFIDTLVICTMTGLVIVITDAWLFLDPTTGEGLNGAVLTSWAFTEGLRPVLGELGKYIVTLSIPFYAFSTSVTWSYYGDRAVDYIWGPQARPIYRWIYVGFQFLGAIWSLELVWNFADITLGLMAIPNMIGVVGLSGVLVRLTKDYFSREQSPTR